MKRLLLTLFAVIPLAACQTEMESGGNVASASASPIPAVGFDASVSNAAVDSCLTALDAMTDGTVNVVASEFSQANSAVYMEVGPQRAPWRCLVADDGRNPQLMYLGTDG